jgi:UDP-2-acetamido-3-amino-2,3-dideoxy-glucuronate N-acetyltransferase
VLGQNVFIGENVKIGNGVKIENNVSIFTGVTLEDDVFCGPSAVFTNVKTPRSAFPRNDAKRRSKTRVKRGATIGANATIICGANIGRHAFVGAGAVVTDDVEGFALVVGNPARRIGWRCVCGEEIKFKKQTSLCKAHRRLRGLLPQVRVLLGLEQGGQSRRGGEVLHSPASGGAHSLHHPETSLPPGKT